MKRLYLIRHAEADFWGAGRGDHGRRLTPEGKEQATRLGRMLADAGIEVVLCSDADRARQTARRLGLSAEVRESNELYNASTVSLTRALSTLSDDVQVAALVAHAPGVPDLVDELSGINPDPDALALLSRGYPTATASGIEFEGSWAHLEEPRLFWVGRG